MSDAMTCQVDDLVDLRPTATELVDGGHGHVTPDGTVWRHTDPDCTAPVGAKEDRP